MVFPFTWSFSNLLWQMMQYSPACFFLPKMRCGCSNSLWQFGEEHAGVVCLHMFLLRVGVVYCSAEQIAQRPSACLELFSSEIRNYVARTFVSHYVWTQANSLWRVSARCSWRRLEENPSWHYFCRDLCCLPLWSTWRTFLSAHISANNHSL